MGELERWREAARACLDEAAWNFLETGSGDEITVEEAESAWKSWRFRPRVLRDVTLVDPAVSLFGQELSSPVLVAPTAFHGRYHPDGEIATAQGSAAAGSLMCLSTRSTRRLDQVAATGVPWWLQVYAMERAVSDGLVMDAVAAGAKALVLTGDTPYLSTRARSGRALALDDASALVNVAPHLAGRGIEALEQDPSLTAEEIERLAELSGLPVLVKGVLRDDDAIDCVEAGAAGIVVSNHGGRQLDRALPTALALPEVVDAVGGRVPVLVDGGIRSGHDVLAALALGADAVLVGRPVVHALAAQGAAGVEALLTHLTTEFGQVLGLSGCRTVTELDRSFVVGPQPSW